jgi:hypothetical protein
MDHHSTNIDKMELNKRNPGLKIQNERFTQVHFVIRWSIYLTHCGDFSEFSACDPDLPQLACIHTDPDRGRDRRFASGEEKLEEEAGRRRHGLLRYWLYRKRGGDDGGGRKVDAWCCHCYD